MPDPSLEERLAAVERALADGERSTDAGDDPDADRHDRLDDPDAEHHDRLDDPDAEHHDRLDDLEAEVADLRAAVRAIRGYVGEVRHVNERIEQRADAALAKAEAVERRVDGAAADAPVGDPAVSTPTAPGDGPGQHADRPPACPGDGTADREPEDPCSGTDGATPEEVGRAVTALERDPEGTDDDAPGGVRGLLRGLGGDG